MDDPTDATHAYAVLERSTLLDFENEVPRLDSRGQPYESGLPPSGGSNASAVRIISDDDFARIITEGMAVANDSNALPRFGGLSEDQLGFNTKPDFRSVREKILTSRSFRDASFARQVKRAYGAVCAMSGLELRNGGGRPEVEAAHIIPIAENGPDIIQNGIALSGTIHWMFDRGLVSVDEDASILIASGSVADPVAERLFVADRKLLAPSNAALRPGKSYIRWHRDNVFKG